MKRVIVHIDRLVLRGFRDGTQSGIAAGLRAELGRTLSAPGIAERLMGVGNVASVRAGEVRFSPAAKAEATGVSAARAIAKGIGR